MKKLLFVLVLACLGLFPACGSSAGNSSGAPKESPRESVVFWSYYETEAQKKALDAIVQGFNASQQSYEAQWEYVPMADFTKRLSIGMMQGGLPDLALIDNPDMAYYIQLGLFADITEDTAEWLEPDFYYQAVLDSTRYQGRLYGLPFLRNSAALIYNKKMLREAGVEAPSTWTELREASRKLTGDGVWGFGISALRYEQATFQFLPWVFSTGATLNTLDGRKGIRAFLLFHDLIADGSLSRDCVNWSQVDLGRKFVRGEIAMMENGPWILPQLKSAENLEWGIAELPKDSVRAAVLGGENMGVIDGDGREGALAFLRYCAQPDVIESYCEACASLPPRRDLAEQPRWKDSKDYSVFVKQLSYSISRGQYTNWPSISEALSTHFCNMLLGTESPEEASSGTAAVIENLNNSQTPSAP